MIQLSSTKKQSVPDEILKSQFKLEEAHCELGAIYRLIETGHIDPDDYQLHQILTQIDGLMGAIEVIYSREKIKPVIESSRKILISQEIFMRFDLPIPPDDDNPKE